MTRCEVFFSKLRHYFLLVLYACLIFYFVLLFGCGTKKSEQWFADAHYVEESLVLLPCGKVNANILASLEERENISMFGGNFMHNMENREGECGRFVLQTTFSGDIDAVVILVPVSWDATRVAVCQKNRGPASRDLAFAVERWADKK